MTDSQEARKLSSLLKEITTKAEKTLRLATDMKDVYKAQASLEVAEQITTQFFREVKRTYEPTKLEL